MAEEKKHDVLIPLGTGEDGMEALRIGEEGVRACRIVPVEDGTSLEGKEVLQVSRLAGPLMMAETVYDGRSEEQKSGKGPAKVNSASYRSGWDAVFGKRKDAGLN